MTIPQTRRGTMALYSHPLDPYSHRVRIVLAEKQVAVDILDVVRNPKVKEELDEINPYGGTPTLTDRDLVIYQSEIIMEYLEERFPHPPLMPVYPVARARSRLMIYRINRDWYKLMDKILQSESGGESASDIADARKSLRDSLISISPVFLESPYFLSEEFSLVDCCVAPLLWRLPSLKIDLPAQAKPLLSYAERLFKREAFMASLTDAEKTLRE